MNKLRFSWQSLCLFENELNITTTYENLLNLCSVQYSKTFDRIGLIEMPLKSLQV